MDFVTFEIAKKLKEKNFIGNVEIGLQCGFYYKDGEDIDVFYDGYDNADAAVDEYLRPTISQVLKWLRNEKEIYCLPHFEQGIDMWLFCIERPLAGTEFAEYISESIYNTYEEAALAGIKYVLDNLI